VTDYIELEAPKALINSALYWCPQLKDMEGTIIAGGFIRAFYAGEQPADLDLYFRSEDDYTDALDILDSNDEWKEVFHTDRAVSYKRNNKKLQAISFYYGNPEDVIKGFDFTVCAAALTLEFPEPTDEDNSVEPIGKVLIHKDFFEHLAGRILIYTGGSPLPLSSLKRAFKYIKRGYNICDENIIAIASAIYDRVEFDDPDALTMHIAGMDPDGARRLRAID